GPQHRDDRLARARFLKEICGQNAFPYGSDLGKGHRFSKEGIWMPRSAYEALEIEQLVEDLLQLLVRDPAFTRPQRRRLSRRNNFTAYVRSEPMVLRLLPGEKWPLPFGRELAESGDLRRYILGEVSRDEANRKLRVYLTDPVIFYKTWFEHYGRGSVLDESRQKIATKLPLMMEKLQTILDDETAIRAEARKLLHAKGDEALSPEYRKKVLKLTRDLRTFRSEITSVDELCERVPVWTELVGEESARVAAQIVFAFHREKRRIKPSDSVDFMHAIYLPHTDVWRGDKAFSDLLIKHK